MKIVCFVGVAWLLVTTIICALAGFYASLPFMVCSLVAAWRGFKVNRRE